MLSIIHEKMLPQIEVVAAIMPEEALKREIPKFHLTMHCFWCHIESGSLTLKEHEAARWLREDQLDSVDWLPADKVVVENIW